MRWFEECVTDSLVVAFRYMPRELQQPLPELALSAGASSGAAAAGRTREHRRLVPLPRTAPRSAHSKPSSRLSLLLLKIFATIWRKKVAECSPAPAAMHPGWRWL